MTQQKRSWDFPLSTRSAVLSSAASGLEGRATGLNLGNRSASSRTSPRAKNLGSFPPGNRKFKDAVGSGNSTDLFRFEVTSDSRIKLFLTNLSSDGVISGAILNAAGKVVTANGKRQFITVEGGEKVSTLIQTAKPGTYALQIRNASSGKNPYEVNLFVNRKGGPAPLPCGCGV